MSEVYLLVTSGGGPEECRIAVGHAVRRIREDAEQLGLDINISDESEAPTSVVIMIEGQGASTISRSWIGTVLWRQKSTVRKNHRRSNWFIGIFEVPGCGASHGVTPEIPRDQVRFSTFRAGGPGGQHQNTTDSAVRATWEGFVAVSRDERSQHRNKAKALVRLNQLVQTAQSEGLAERSRGTHRMHRTFERGNPRKIFSGEKFLGEQ